MSYDDHSIALPGQRPKNCKQDWNAHAKAPRKQYDDDDAKHCDLWAKCPTVTLMHRRELRALIATQCVRLEVRVLQHYYEDSSNVRDMFFRGPRLRSRLLRTGERPVNGNKYATVMRQDFIGDVRTSQHLLSNRVSLSAPEKK